MKIKMPLRDLRQGDVGYVCDLTVSGPLRRRLLDLGLTESTLVQCVLKRGNDAPAVYFIRGARIALRAADAAKIMIYVSDIEENV